MATFCLTSQAVEKVKAAFKDGTLPDSPEKFSELTSKERHDLFSKIIGEDSAGKVNALIESKLLLVNQEAGLVNAVQTILGEKHPAARDLLSKIGRMDRILNPSERSAFMEDLASQKLGIHVTFEEAQRITGLSSTVRETKTAIPENSPIRSQERIAYGIAYNEFQKYVGELKAGANKLTFKEWLSTPFKEKVGNALYDIAGTTKSLLSTLDNSFFGRQGLKMLMSVRNTDIWAKNFIKSWGDIGKELKGVSAMDAINADKFSRPNMISGKYDAMKLDVGMGGEEAFPSTLPEKIPVLGRVFKGAESAFNGAAIRMRLDYADRVIKLAEKHGLDVTGETALSLGKLVNSMTGRGSIGKVAVLGKEINAGLFSVRFLKSNWDTLTAHQFDSKMDSFSKKQAAKNLASIVTSTAALAWTINQLQPNSVSYDPRDSNFMKFKTPNGTVIDLTGGIGSIAIAAARLTPTKHGNTGGMFGDGWGFWSKSGTTGKWTDLSEAKYGQQTGVDIWNNFWEGKISPFPGGVLRDVWAGKNYQGEKPTPSNVVKNLVSPIPVQTFEQLKNSPDASNIFMLMLLDGLGWNVNPPSSTKKK